MKKRKYQGQNIKLKKEEIIKKLLFASINDIKTVLKKMNSSIIGLDEKVILEHRSTFGKNIIVHGEKKSLLKKLIEAFINPFTAILFFLALVSMITDIIIPIYNNLPENISTLTVVIIIVMVGTSGILRFIQEYRSGNAAEKLLKMITTTCTVTRKEEGIIEIPLEEVVVGDIIHLSTGDMLPADVRIIEAKDFFVSQASLTGESDPIEKNSKIIQSNQIEKISVTEYSNIAFMGSSVVSGSAVAVVITVGNDTLFGSMTASITTEEVETNFTKGVNTVSWVLIRFMFIMVPVVFFINGFTKGDWLEAFLFAISIAIGLTPEMLPMIVTTCLAKGAVSMSKEKTIIKNLNSIQNFGAIDILCTDKTGTLTQDKVILQYHMDISGKENIQILYYAYLNSFFQTGYKNLIDLAIINKAKEEFIEDISLVEITKVYHKIDEIPFDFTRRRLSIIVEDKNKKRQMITKGAVEEMLSICNYIEYNGVIVKLSKDIVNKILCHINKLNQDGMRVIAVAQKNLKDYASDYENFGVEDEQEMILMGYLAFLDPPKESTVEAIKTLNNYGIKTKILTGDNEKVTKCICKQVGLKIDNILLGNDIDRLNDLELIKTVEKTNIFAKLSPDQKERIVTALRNGGHIVGFMGDGINDAAAMKAADVGISVDTAVDIAKESADIILLEKDLMVLEKGIIEGRKTYANMIKYIKMTASSNFGNMFSVLAASALLPFLPMESIHLIILNLIYDLSCAAIPWDNVDEEFISSPRKWDASNIGNFMIWIGPTSSIFDWTTYAFMYFIFCPMFVSGGVLYNDLPFFYTGNELLNIQNMYSSLFQTGWFVESMWSQTLVIHMIRTSKIPFIQSRASLSLTLLTFTGIAILTIIPFTKLGILLGFTSLPITYFLYLIPCILLYMALATSLKKAYIKCFGTLL